MPVPGRDQLSAASRYVRGLGPYLRATLEAPEADRRLRDQLRRRETSFLDLIEKSVFERAERPAGGGPYLALLRNAGVEAGDVRELVVREGLEGALGALYDAGVYVTLDEFKGRRPIRRGRLELDVRPEDFDNPLLARDFEARTGGSRGGVGRRVLVDFDLLTHESAYYLTFLQAFDLVGRPSALWRSPPPAADGIKQALRFAKLGLPAERWFTPNRLAKGAGELGFFAFTSMTTSLSRLVRSRVPHPEYVPMERAIEVARWLGERVEAGRPALLDASASASVRACLAAKREGIDLEGTFFRIGGEPHTDGKDAAIRDVGGRAAAHYAMAEAGTLGIACADREHLDEVHLLSDKIAVVEREASAALGGPDSARPGALVLTTVLPSCPRLMINVESDDFGVLSTRRCGCPFGELGFSRHLHRIRSYEKLTSEGVTFLGTELIRLVEEVLPARFGGDPTDYQLVERERGGLSRVAIVASPRLGSLEEREVLDEVERTLAEYPGGSLMIDNWRQAGTLELERSEPRATASAKIHPLHVVAAHEADGGESTP